MSHRAEIKTRPIAMAFAAMTLIGTVLACVPASAELPFGSALAPSTWGDHEFDGTGDGQVRNIRMAEADCSAAAAEAAAQTGGQVLSVSSRDQGGQTVCVVTVLVPGEDGQRPRKRTITLPQ